MRINRKKRKEKKRGETKVKEQREAGEQNGRTKDKTKS